MKLDRPALFDLLDLQFTFDDEERTCQIECQITDMMLNPLGTVHGGMYTYIADSAMGHLAIHNKQNPYVSLELKTSFLKTAHQGKLIATARYVKDGYKILFMECVVENEEGETMSVSSGTFYRVEKR